MPKRPLTSCFFKGLSVIRARLFRTVPLVGLLAVLLPFGVSNAALAAGQSTVPSGSSSGKKITLKKAHSKLTAA